VIDRRILDGREWIETDPTGGLMIIVPSRRKIRIQKNNAGHRTYRSISTPGFEDNHPFLFLNSPCQGERRFVRNVCSAGSGPQLMLGFGGRHYYSTDLALSTSA
jgi:hypothetical protein